MAPMINAALDPQQLMRLKALAALYGTSQGQPAVSDETPTAPAAPPPAPTISGGTPQQTTAPAAPSQPQTGVPGAPSNASGSTATPSGPPPAPTLSKPATAAPSWSAPGSFARAAGTLPPAPADASNSTATQSSAPSSYADRYRQWEESEPKNPNPDDFKSSIWRKLFGAGVGFLTGLRNPELGGEMASEIANPKLARARQQYAQDEARWRDQGSRIAEEGRLSEFDQQLADRRAAAQRQVDNRTLDQMYTDAVRAGDKQSQSEILQAIHGLKGAERGEETPFTAWRAQNPNAPISEYFKAEKGPKTFASPFEAFAYGAPEEKKAAQDFLKLEGQQKRLDRPTSELEQRYQLYRTDPDAYKAMFGERGSAQDQAQATRMLKYFDGRRKELQNDFTLDEPTKQQKLAELDDLEKPYLVAAGEGGAAPTNPPASASAGSKGRTAAGDQNAGGPHPDEVEVVNPQGQRGYIPKANLAEALKRGYKQVTGQ